MRVINTWYFLMISFGIISHHSSLSIRDFIIARYSANTIYYIAWASPNKKKWKRCFISSRKSLDFCRTWGTHRLFVKSILMRTTTSRTTLAQLWKAPTWSELRTARSELYLLWWVLLKDFDHLCAQQCRTLKDRVVCESSLQVDERWINQTKRYHNLKLTLLLLVGGEWVLKVNYIALSSRIDSLDPWGIVCLSHEQRLSWYREASLSVPTWIHRAVGNQLQEAKNLVLGISNGTTTESMKNTEMK